MSPQIIGIIGIGCLLILAVLRVPVATALILVGTGGYWAIDGFMLARITLGDVPFRLAQAYSLAVVPLFLLMGIVASKIEMAQDIYRAFHALLGHLKGGIAMATVGTCAGFGAICGSSLATASTMTQVCLPQLRHYGTADRIAAGVIASGGTLGILIPPSIILVIYAIIAQESVPRLFAAAMLPGVLLVVLHIVLISIIARRRPAWIPVHKSPVTQHRLGALLGLWKMVLVFAIVVGGIYAGWFSTTEAAAIGAFATMVIGVVTRRLNYSRLMDALRETITTTGSLFFIVLGAFMFAAFIVQSRIPLTLGAWVAEAGLQPLSIIGLFLLVFLFLGCFLDSISMILITVPVFLPIAEAAGYSPVWFGVFIVIVAEIGLITPPVGLNLFVLRAQAPDLSLTELYRGIVPFLFCHLTAIGLLVAFPALTLWLPEWLYPLR